VPHYDDLKDPASSVRHSTVGAKAMDGCFWSELRHELKLLSCAKGGMILFLSIADILNLKDQKMLWDSLYFNRLILPHL
jgi:hypothetical protein